MGYMPIKGKGAIVHGGGGVYNLHFTPASYLLSELLLTCTT